MINRKLGQYEIIEELGRGGMGAVYRARQMSLNRDVALKILPSAMALDPTALERFRREAMAVAQLAHPNIVQVHDIGEDSGLHFIAMEYVRGRTAAGLLKAEGPLPFRKALDLCAPIAAALGVAHKAGIVHRDVKPSNILVSEAGFAKLADFGVAGLMQAPEGERLTMTGAAVGTPYYMSPEQVRGREALDGASDVYSLGVVLYELLAGAHPFGDATTAEAIIKQVQDPFPPIRRYRSDIPDKLEQVLGRCLAKDRAERYPNGEALCQALEKARLQIDLEKSDGDGDSGDYRKRVSGTGFFYVDAAQKREANAAVGLRALCREMVAQVRDPNKRQRRALQALYTRSLLARDEYKRGETQLEELRKRLKHHQDKAAQHRAQAQKLIEDGRADEAAASAETESACEKLALDYGHQAEELGKQVQELRERYDAAREEHSQAADELALLDAEARRAGKPIPTGGEDARLAAEARLLRRGVMALTILVLLAGCWWGLSNRPRTLPLVVTTPPSRPAEVRYAPAPIPKDDLILYYPFDKDEGGKVSDQSGNANDAVVQGAIWTPEGHLGGAYAFNGLNSMIVRNEMKWPSGSAFTLCMFIRSIGACPNRTYTSFINFREILNFSYDYSRDEFNFYNMGDSSQHFPGNVKGRWSHVAIVFDHTTFCLYVDGVLRTQRATQLVIPPGTSGMLGIGAYPPDLQYFNGFLDEVRVYRRALSMQEIQRLCDKTLYAMSKPASTSASVTAHPSDKLFPTVATASITASPYDFCVDDFNGDGKPDLAVSDLAADAQSVDIYLNNGDGALVEKARYRVGSKPQQVLPGDFDEDGRMDLLVAVYLGSLGSGTMHLLKGKGDGTFELAPGFSPKVGGKGLNPCYVTVGDLNKDRHLDFAVCMNNDWAVNVHYGDGDGTFVPKFTLANGQNPGNPRIARLDNDEWPDIVCGSQYTSLFVHLSDGNAGFKPAVQYLAGTSHRQPVFVEDMNQDEDFDLVVAEYQSHYVSVLLNDGKGSFADKGRIDFTAGANLCGVTDFDSDGQADLVLTESNRLLVVPGRGDGTFGTPVSYEMGHTILFAKLQDLDGDRRMDLVLIDHGSNRALMRLNRTPR